MPAGGKQPPLGAGACGAKGGWPVRTFNELVVVILQRRALLSHVCCSACTQGCTGAVVGAGVSRLLGWGVTPCPWVDGVTCVLFVCVVLLSHKRPILTAPTASRPAATPPSTATPPRPRLHLTPASNVRGLVG